MPGVARQVSKGATQQERAELAEGYMSSALTDALCHRDKAADSPIGGVLQLLSALAGGPAVPERRRPLHLVDPAAQLKMAEAIDRVRARHPPPPLLAAGR